MSTKLTLSISDKELIEEAKQYAKEQNQSLSRIIENYLRSLTRTKRESKSKEPELSPLVESRVGTLGTDKDFDYKKERDEMYDEKLKKYRDE